MDYRIVLRCIDGPEAVKGKLLMQVLFADSELEAYANAVGRAQARYGALTMWTEVVEQQTYFFTYGSDEPGLMPFKGGWSIVIAKNRAEAIEKHIAKYGLTPDGFGRYAMEYSPDEFAKTSMFAKCDNLGAGLHEVIE